MELVEELVVRAQTGDGTAFEAIVRRFEKMAFGYAYSLLGDYDLAEDARQDAFLDAWCDLLALKNPASFPAWLRKIVYRQSINYVRGRRILTVPLDGAADIAHQGPGPKAQLSEVETRERIEEAIAGLPAQEHEVVQLFYLNEMSLKEINRATGLPTKLIKSRLHMARARLRERMMNTVKKVVKKQKLTGDRRPEMLAASMAIENFDRELRTLVQFPDADKQSRAGDLLRARGRMQRFMGQTELALNSFQEAMALPVIRKNLLSRTRLRAELGITYAHRGEFIKARKELQSARLASQRKGSDPLLLGVVLNTLGVCAWGTGDYRQSRRYYCDAAKISLKSRSHELEAEAQNNLALLDWKAGRLEQAHENFQACNRLWKKIGNRFGRAATLVNIGIIEENLGRFIPAHRHYKEALALAKEIDYGQAQTAACSNLANLALIQNNWQEALELGRQARELAKRIDDQRSEAIALENIALATMQSGNSRLFKESLAEARRLAETIGDRERGFSLDLLEIEDRLGRGEAAGTLERIQEANKTLPQQGYRSELPRLLRLEAVAHHLQGANGKARMALQRGLRESRKQKNRVEEQRLQNMHESFKSRLG